MQTQRETIRFIIAGQELWLRQFPALSRRAQWHLASHLAVRARDGAALGELYGLVKQVFLLDDATVRERVNELCGLGLCRTDPADGPLSARSVVLPTPALLDRYDAYLRDVGARLLALGAAVAGGSAGRAGPLDPPARQALLRAVEICQETWLGASETVFDAAGLSRARRLDARRNLLSVSHGSLLAMALAREYGLSPVPADGEGLLADQLAAALLGLIRQNFQTTRDHIAYLVRVGLLERRPGRVLRVALAAPAQAPFDRALEVAGTELARQAQALATSAPTPAVRSVPGCRRPRPGPGSAAAAAADHRAGRTSGRNPAGRRAAGDRPGPGRGAAAAVDRGVARPLPDRPHRPDRERDRPQFDQRHVHRWRAAGRRRAAAARRRAAGRAVPADPC